MEKVEFSARASRLNVWTTVGEHVKIKQKVLKRTPLDKLLDCLINILAGGTGLVEIKPVSDQIRQYKGLLAARRVQNSRPLVIL